VIVAVRIALLVFVAAILQAVIFSSTGLLGGTPDLLLVIVVSLALLRGSIAGAAAGFAGGLLLDVATLGTLGVTALILTVAGYWAGRYGETTGRDRAHAPLLAIVVITLLVGVGSYAVYFLLGESVSAREALVTTLLPGLALNLVIGAPLYALCRRFVGFAAPRQPPGEVEVVV
jgi:rod shape-determining protein MreD